MKAIVKYTNDYKGNKKYECKIDSLQDLIDIYNKEDQDLIISCEDDILYIEVYDGYRE